jgi:hypothetical protein
MSEILVKLMLQCGATYCDDTDMIVSEEELVKYTNLIISEKDKEINQLKNQLFTAKSQNEIYKGALYDSH